MTKNVNVKVAKMKAQRLLNALCVLQTLYKEKMFPAQVNIIGSSLGRFPLVRESIPEAYRRYSPKGECMREYSSMESLNKGLLAGGFGNHFPEQGIRKRI
jgi:hypothetical protein